MKIPFLFILPQIFDLSIEVYFIVFIIAVTTFFFLNWLFKKFIKPNNTRKIVTWLTTLTIVPIIYETVISLFFFALFYTPNRDFNELRWAADKKHRFQMAENIVDSKILIDKDSNQVKHLLGNPTFRVDSVKQWNYYLGGEVFSFHNLIIKFKKNKVTSILHQKIED